MANVENIGSSPADTLRLAFDLAHDGYDPFAEHDYGDLVQHLEHWFEPDERIALGTMLGEITDDAERRRALNGSIFVKLLERSRKTKEEFTDLLSNSF